MEKKKNSKRFIIPAENFISTEKIPSKKVSEEAKEVIESNEHPEPKKETPVAVELPTSEEKEVITETKPQVDLNKRKKASGLSLKSIQQKKKHEKEIKERLAIPEEELSEDFTEEQVQEAWKDVERHLPEPRRQVDGSEGLEAWREELGQGSQDVDGVRHPRAAALPAAKRIARGVLQLPA